MSGPGIIRRTALRAAAPVLKRWYTWWNGRERQVRVDRLDFVVLPGVFPPHFFFSTRLLAEHVRSLPLQGRTFLDLGTGSGRVALTAARAGAIVTACDLNPAAVTCATNNAARNNLRITAVLSDQFDAVPDRFDVIAINPPYYDREPKTPAEHAFLAGDGLRYFQRLFQVLADRIRQGSEVFVVLSEDLDLDRIRSIARKSDLGMDALQSARRWGETSTVFMIRRLSDARSSPTGS